MTTISHKVLVLLGHPSLHLSRVNKALRDAIQDIKNVTVHDLYDAYPEFYIDTSYEQQLLLQHELIVFQHPMYWYSTPPILKLWQDVVYSQGFAYGKGGTALQGKDFIQVISTGGKAEAYQHDGSNQFTIDELLAPMKATAKKCGMQFHSPLVLHHSYKASDAEIVRHATKYRELLTLYTIQGTKSLEQGEQ